VWGWKAGKIPFSRLADAVLEFYIFLQRPQNARKELIFYYKKIDSISGFFSQTNLTGFNADLII